MSNVWKRVVPEDEPAPDAATADQIMALADAWCDEVVLEVTYLGSQKGLADAHVALRAAVEQLARDAERYRWLRDTPWPPDLVSVIQMHQNGKWDAAIDAAMKEGK